MGTSAILFPRLTLPNQRFRLVFAVGAHSVRPQAGLGPAPTDIPECARFFVGAGALTRPPRNILIARRGGPHVAARPQPSPL